MAVAFMVAINGVESVRNLGYFRSTIHAQALGWEDYGCVYEGHRGKVPRTIVAAPVKACLRALLCDRHLMTCSFLDLLRRRI